MKDNHNRDKKIPWYVRYNNSVEKFIFGKTLKVIFVLVFILASIISYSILKNRAQMPYNEFYDIEFKNYINTKLDDIAKVVIDEGVGIELHRIPQTVEEYAISGREEGISFSCLLNTEKIIAEYYKETGKSPKKTYSEKVFGMDILMSKNFEDIIKTTSIEPPTMTCEEYQQQYPKEIVINAFGNGLIVLFILLISFIPILLFSIFPAFATDKWIQKQEREGNKCFQNEN